MADDALRCAVHPSIPAVDSCPVCARPRCTPDAAAAPGGGCLACEGRRARSGPPPLNAAALVGAAAAANVAAGVGGQIASQYVDAGWIGWVVPVFVGIVVSMAAEFGARKRRGRALRIVAAFYSVLAVAVEFQSPFAAGEPFSLATPVLGSYLIAAATSWLWTAPPRVVPRKPETG